MFKQFWGEKLSETPVRSPLLYEETGISPGIP